MIISLGGSVITPSNIDIYAIKYFVKTLKEIDERTIVVVGGGSLARQYINTIISEKRDFEKIKHKLDDLGILATIMNAELISLLSNLEAVHPSKISMKKAITIMKKRKKTICSGWKPGFSTDYVTAYIAKQMKEDFIINITKVGGIFTKDPTKHLDAKLIKELTWNEYLEMFDDSWIPGKNVPFDNSAAFLCKTSKIKVFITNLENFEKFVKNKEMIGTLIR
ncbi:MAG: UMP kinase [Candidatus Woesearchaeota archaeon]